MWIPKYHKHPTKFRFIAVANICTTKTLSALITTCLKTVQIECRKICSSFSSSYGINPMWIINNSKRAQAQTKTMSETKVAKNLNVYDVSTLYTSRPHK